MKPKIAKNLRIMYANVDSNGKVTLIVAADVDGKRTMLDIPCLLQKVS